MEAEKGDNFYTAVNKVKATLVKQDDYKDLVFNGLSIRVSKDSNINDLCSIYDLKHKIRRLEAGYKD